MDLLQRTLFVVTACLMFGAPARVVSMSASFYGNSFIHLPLESASSTSEIKLHFRTHRQHGLLMLMAGQTDYCIIELQSGMIQVRLDLGSGEAILWSPVALALNDLAWHYVHLVHSQGKVKLTIDRIYETNTKTKGQLFELNINHIFLGGMGTFDIFRGNFNNFRGCMRYVLFNTIDVFHDVRLQNNPMNLYEVSWDCSPEFGASSDQPISLLRNTSYIAFPHLHAREGGTVAFDLRTKSDTALVLYNSGHVTNRDFVALELIEGKIRVTLDKGSGPLVLDSGIKVNDGRWHQVEFIVTFNSLEVIIDDKRKDLRSNFGNQRYLDLVGHLFIGGVGLSSRAHAIKKGLYSLRGTYASAGSLLGCIRNLKLNDRLSGLGEAEVTHGIRPNCVWQYSCNRRPCVNDAVCTEEGYTGFRCECGKSNCYKSPEEIDPAVSMSDLVALQNVRVREGTRTIITSNNIDVTLEYARYNLRDSDVIFRVVTPPKHGQVFVDITKGSGTPTFTLQHLNNDKVFYIHDGSESKDDSIGIELSFDRTITNLPSQLRHKYGFALFVRISPENDRPVMKLPQDDTLIVVEKTSTRITPKIMSVVDDDTEPDHLIYTVEYQDSDQIGFFEKADNPGEQVSTFSQEDINVGIISYVHRGMKRLHVRLQVTDGSATSEAIILQIHAKSLELIVIANTGLIIPPLSSQLIHPSNLTMATNAPKEEVDVRYQITQMPRYGIIQRQQYTDQKWTSVQSFAQRHINKGRLRYVHNDKKHYQADLFKFTASVAGARSSNHEFHIKFVHVNVGVVKNERLLLNGFKQISVSTEHLKAESNLPNLSPRAIIYNLVTGPEKGDLLKMRDSSRPSQYHRHKLRAGTTFSQYDVDSGFIWYKIRNARDQDVLDSFEFSVSVPGATSALTTFYIKYVPLMSDYLLINNELVDVPEGGKKKITKDHLYMEKEQMKKFRFSLLSYPSYGVIQLIDPDSQTITHQNVSTFTNNDIIKGKVFYQHDDSETDFDTFSFMTTPILDRSSTQPIEIEEMSGNFEIRILLRNDCPPVRIADAVLQVVKNRGRRITDRDFNYHDPDVDFESKKLQYHQEGITNGKIVRTDNHSVEVHEFTQQEVNEGKLYFMHRGAPYGEFSLWVSDGQFQVSGQVEVKASNPYVEITRNEGLIVEKGQESKITHHNISVDTNMDVSEDEIVFLLTRNPRFGKIMLKNEQKDNFTLAELRSGNLIYKHDSSNHLEDFFRYTVKVKDIQTKGETRVKVFLESHYRPPQVVYNKVLIVNEEETSVIKKTTLQITHQETSTGNIVFTVRLAPNFGNLKIYGENPNKAVDSFTQADINAGRILYQQKVPGQYLDRFIFDVSNGIQTLRGLEFIIEIIPLTIPLNVANISLTEGERKPLPDYLFKVPNKYFQHDFFEYIVIRQPENGWIQFAEPGQRLAHFTSEELANGRVYYAHDDSDTEHDQFSILAKSKTTGKQSNPHTVYITIKPVNDQPPEVKVNRGLRVWLKSTTPITAQSLRTVDPDTPMDDLVYRVTRPSNGHIEVVGAKDKTVRDFTQRNISDGRVLFVHKGAEEGSFKFQVSDDLHYTEEITFQIHAVPLVLKLSTNKELQVFPGTTQPITLQHLLAETNDPNQSEPISFTLQSKPRHGKLQIMYNGGLAETETFSQNEIEHGFVVYQHTESMIGWTMMDTFVFEVTTKYANVIRYQNFVVKISFDNINEENVGQLISMDDVHCQEGGQVVIGERNLDISTLKEKLIARGIRQATVELLITQVPQNGILIVDNKNASVGTKITQKIINRGKLKYRHNHSDTKWDTFYFAVQISKDGQSLTSVVYPNVFNITILSYNDQPFRIVTRHPNLSVLQGAIANLTKDNLEVIDPDSPPSDITYRIVEPPLNGKLVFRERPKKKTSLFTQEDINQNRILFNHDGSASPDGDSFVFSVSDGSFPSYHETFDIDVLPVTLELVNLTRVFIVQGRTTFFLSNENIAAETTGRVSDIIYTVTTPPMLGKLFVGDKPTLKFSQSDLNTASVLYVQTNLTGYSDSFMFTVENPKKIIEKNLLKIVVVPLVRQRPFTSTANSNIPITTDSLDATELSLLTNSMPTFNIEVHPKHGELINMINYAGRRILREAPFSETNGNRLRTFTQGDLEKGAVRYQAHPTTSYSVVNDSFTFVLTAKNVQPARGVFYITVELQPPQTRTVPVQRVTILPITETDSSVDTASKPVGELQPSMKTMPGGKKGNTHLTVIVVIIAVVIVIIIIIIVVRCIKKKRKSRDYAMRMNNSEKQLPQPNVHIEPKRYHDRRGMDDCDRMDFSGTHIPVVSVSSDQLQQITTSVGLRVRSAPTSPETKRVDLSKSVPMCKVTPLLDEEDDNTDLKTSNAGTWKSNESGAEQQSFDWDSLDPELLQHCRTTNPVLHKDKYWV